MIDFINIEELYSLVTYWCKGYDLKIRKDDHWIEVLESSSSRSYLLFRTDGLVELNIRWNEYDPNEGDVLNKLLEVLISNNIIIHWNEDEKYGYLAISENFLIKHHFIGYINALIQENLKQRIQISKLEDKVDRLQYLLKEDYDD